ncbi:hypothetical protein [Carnobacterium inhibens]|uniref:hypothetical protein n=1 Tax=Carnobacterium inhibens TaxID=147709 RepID=UPI000558C099|nr:hypothetical protein [Carnobacterium inhibens]
MVFNADKIIKQAYKNKDSIVKSDCCGCYNCTKLFTPNKVEEYVDNGQTAICPYCGMDSVIGTNMGYNITTNFLKQLKKEIFEF